jgi:ferredoxin
MGPKDANGQLLVCNCQRSMQIDGGELAAALGLEGPVRVHRELCRSEIKSFEAALGIGGAVHVACTQEAPVFRETAHAAAKDGVDLTFTNIRERAGWCESKADALPKMAALLAEAAYSPKPAGLITLESAGLCLVYGAGQAALDAAMALSGRLDVTLLLTDAQEVLPPSVAQVPIATGKIKTLKGHLGSFEVEVDAYAPALPSSRAGLEFALARNGARSRCDLVLDMSGGAPLMREHARCDGYHHVQPDDPAALARAMLGLTDLVGEFEKPLYVGYDAAICAHARSGITGCSRCIDTCPLGVITPNGDGVTIDHAACGGCGGCNAVCPTGAASYAYPARQDLVGRARILLDTFAKAGGKSPVLLLHEERHGGELIAACSRFGRGLPPNVLPISLHAATSLGHEVIAAMLAYGAEHVVILLPPDKRDEAWVCEDQAQIVRAVLSGLGHAGGKVHVLVEADPDAVESALYALDPVGPLARASFAPTSGKRETARLAFAALHAEAPNKVDRLSLPEGAPYGTISIDAGGCTLCLSCVGACPTGALSDNPDRPQVSFTEAACVQCGICRATCPEKVISLEARYDFTSAAMTARELKGEAPFDCIRCGKPFGTKSSIERVIERLKGHSMFQDEERLRVIQMCDNCRVITLSESQDDPFRAGERPRIRTTDDYIEAEAQAKARSKKPDDFLN